jgi:hypothetical protein
MKPYFLVGVSSVAAAKEALRAQLPGQEEPWLLLDSLEDPIAYFNAGDQLDGEKVLHVQADISGRHYNKDAAVLAVLKRLQAAIGGVVTDDA